MHFCIRRRNCGATRIATTQLDGLSNAPRIGRRSLLTGGAAFAAGTVGLVTAEPAGAAAPVNVTFGPVPSGGDDTATLQAAMVGTGILRLPPGTYKLAGNLSISNGQDIQGSGGGPFAPATIFMCTSAGSGITVSAGGGITSGFEVDGNNIALQPFVRNGGTGQWVGRTLQDISVVNSAQDGIVCLGSQNDAWYKVVASAHFRDSWVLDQGYGGALFSRCEMAGGGRYNLRIDHQLSGGPYDAPSDNVFHQCIVEYTVATTVSVAYLNGPAMIKFDHTSFYASASTTGPLVDVTGNSTAIAFVDALFQSTVSTQGGVGIRVGSGCQITFSGVTPFVNLATAIYLRSGSPWVDVKGTFTFANCQNRYGADTGMNPQSFVMNSQSEVTQVQRANPDDFTYASANPAGGLYTFETASGRKVWGSGTDYRGDVALFRRAKGVVGVDDIQVIATGYGPASTRPPLSAEMAGAIRLNMDTRRLEVTDGGAWYSPTQHMQVFASSTTYVVPAGVALMRCKIWGGGGGGSGGGNIGALSVAGACYGGTGGGAAMMLDVEIKVTPGDTLTLVVGAGGAGGAGGAAATGATGNAGATGTTGGTSTVTDGSGNLLAFANGGAGGPASPGTSLTAPVLPTGAGGFGCEDVSYWVAAPGCGSFANYNAIPTTGGLSGGASGAYSVPTNGGGSGWAPYAPGQRAIAGVCSSPTAKGMTGASPFLPGCGGNGGGAGGMNAAGGAGGAGSAGVVELVWVS